jgi:superfamily I DNA and/or RNA helicase
MADKYGVVKPADKAEKQVKADKKPQKAKDEGIHKPLALDMKKLQNEEQQKRQGEKAAAKKSKEEEKKKEAEKKEQDQFGKIYSYADQVKSRHTGLSDDLYKKIRSSKTKGEAKRILREYLQSLPLA